VAEGDLVCKKLAPIIPTGSLLEQGEKKRLEQNVLFNGG